MACNADPGPEVGPTIANLRSWPERLEAIAAGLDTAMATTACAGELVRLRCTRRMVGEVREIVADGIAAWDAGEPQSALAHPR